MPAKKSKSVKNRERSTTNYRLEKFTQLVCDGESMYQAAIGAGYSKYTARGAGADLMPRAQEVFRRALAQHAPLGKQAKKIAEGMEAMETKFFQHHGEVVDQRDVIAWGERARYLELAAKCQGFLVDKTEVSGKDGEPLSFSVQIMHIGGK